jgi:hypothetical protein
LRNAVADATAMATALKSSNFRVTLKLDASRSQLLQAIEEFGKKIRNQPAVALFYFAGHAVQLNWRNFLVPVDAQLDHTKQIEERAINLDFLVNQLKHSKARINFIILDACRNNPFGEVISAKEKGLAQMDAPPRTLIAYATAPGAMAIDGSGEHGLYTGRFLQELTQPGVKIEDMLKRVRLSVRVESEGAQVPWESTSLEEDFFFVPSDSKANTASKENQVEQELALWQSIAKSENVEDVEAFIRRFPSGYLAELASYRLEFLLSSTKKQPPVMRPGLTGSSPVSAGTLHVRGGFQVGDNYEMSKRDYFTNLEEERKTLRVTGIKDGNIVINNGGIILDPLGNFIKSGSRTYTPNQLFGAELQLGKRWDVRMKVTNEGRMHTSEYSAKVTAREKVTVPAGTFDAFKVEASGTIRETSDRVRLTYWRSPTVRYPYVKYEIVTENRYGKYKRSDRYELLSYSQAVR